MNVAVLINELTIRGGTHKQVLRFCEYLEAHKVDFTLYTKYLEIDKTYPEFEKFKIVALKNEADVCEKPKKSLPEKLINRIGKMLEGISILKLIPKNIDVINVHDSGFFGLMLIAKIFMHKKIVWQINDLPPCFGVGVFNNGNDTDDSWVSKILRGSYRYLAKRIDKITVNVTKNKERVQQCLGVDACVLYCGVDVNPNLKQHTFQGNSAGFRLLSTGVFFPYRNYETLLEVVEKLGKRGIDVTLDIIGSTELSSAYAAMIQSKIILKKLEKHVVVWGQVDENKYNELYNSADAFAFVNINQSWGLAVFEAMSAGLPVIVSNSVGAIELLQDGIDSVIVDPLNVDMICDAMIKLMNDKSYYELISQNALLTVKNYTWDEAYSSKMLKLFDDLCQ